ncbi:hypothetical protein NDU88_000769 [Pleurodeles waltl]|uniref:Uncharacterized protein n=1 Tax=Pleurodeles waltl TaxID=8319 RepID=A0AAV7S8I4_PLEWA|nr:hypothetical protein NDU88_000769 [Pleurodeles waltl]
MRSCLSLESRWKKRPGAQQGVAQKGRALQHPERPVEGPQAVPTRATQYLGVRGCESAGQSGRKVPAEWQDLWAGWRRIVVRARAGRKLGKVWQSFTKAMGPPNCRVVRFGEIHTLTRTGANRRGVEKEEEDPGRPITSLLGRQR